MYYTLLHIIDEFSSFYLIVLYERISSICIKQFYMYESSTLLYKCLHKNVSKNVRKEHISIIKIKLSILTCNKVVYIQNIAENIQVKEIKVFIRQNHI